MRLSRRGDRSIRIAFIGVVLFGLGIAVLGVWSSWYTLRAVRETQRLVTLNDGWQQARFWIAEEETVERKYRLEKNPWVATYHAQIVTLLTRTVLRLRPASNAADNERITTLLEKNGRYAKAMVAMFRANDAHDERLVETIHERIDPTYDAVEHIAVRQEAMYHHAAYLALARLGKTQQRVAAGYPILCSAGSAAFFAVWLLVRNYRRRTDGLLAKQLERLERAARVDALSGLGNHRAFQIELGRRSARDASRYLALVDVDHFKQANDRFGHLHGDNVLRALGEAIANLPPFASGFRVGGDEFAILFDDVSLDVAVRELEALSARAPIVLQGNTLSIGVASIARDDADLAASHGRADVALYEAKHRGRNRIVVFETSMVHASTSLGSRRMALEAVLANAAATTAVFQAIWSYDRGANVGYEARSRFGSRFAVAADAFATAERLERAFDLDAVCLATIARCLPPGLAGTVHVNVSPTTLSRGAAAVALLRSFCESAALAPERVVVELADAVPVSAEAFDAIVALRALGFRIALDGVCGDGGLSLVGRLPLDVIKLDDSLFESIESDSRKLALASGLFVTAERLGCDVVVGGIRSRDHIRICGELADRYGMEARTFLQGDALGLAVPADELAHVAHHPALRSRVRSDEAALATR